jgi:anti-anti-sigma factor
MIEHFGISTEPACRIIVSGELDLATSPQLDAVIPASGSVWLDFTAVTFLDSSALAILARACSDVRGRGDHFHVSGLNGAPMRVVELASMWDMLCGD